MTASVRHAVGPNGRRPQAGATRVSVVISAYTEERWDQLRDAVRSVLAQADGAVEIIVVIDHCQRLFERSKRGLPGAIVIPSREARGASGARNSGIAAARGDIIAFLDDDTRAEPGWLELLVAPYESEQVVAVGGRIEPDWEQGRPAYFPKEFDWVVGCTYSGMPSRRAIVRNVIGANMSFRREALEASGGFPQGIDRVGLPGKAGWLRFGSEETELCIRIRRRMAPRVVVYEPSAVVAHRVPESRARVRYFASRCLAEGRSKALIAQIAGRSEALETERRYITRVLPASVARCLAAAARGDLAGLLRATMIVAGAGITTLGYLFGTITARRRALASAEARKSQLHAQPQGRA